MREVAIVDLPEAYRTSIGAIEDAVSLVEERRNRVLPDAPVETELRLRLAWSDGPVPDLATPCRAARLPIDGPYVQVDFVWLPGFRIGPLDRAAQRLKELAPVGEWLVRQSKGGAVIGASGAAVLLLLQHHLIETSRIPVSTALVPVLRALYPRVGRDERLPIMQQANIYLSRGFGHDIELAARVLEQLASPASGAWYRSVAGAERVGLPDLAEDPLVSDAQLRIEQSFSTRMSIGGLAAELATSHPTLIRRFRKSLGMTPAEYLSQQRLAAAKRLLAQTTRPIGTIAQMVGFADPRSFRELFRNKEGMSARAYRKGGSDPAKDHSCD